MNPQIMASVRNEPNQAYADEYARVNKLINELSQALAAEIKSRGFRARALAASDRTDMVNIKGDFPHKTAATMNVFDTPSRCIASTPSFDIGLDDEVID